MDNDIPISDIKYAVDNDYDLCDIKVSVCRFCKFKTVLFKDGYTKGNTLRWVNRAGKWHDHNICLECRRERNRENKRNKKSRTESSSL